MSQDFYTVLHKALLKCACSCWQHELQQSCLGVICLLGEWKTSYDLICFNKQEPYFSLMDLGSFQRSELQISRRTLPIASSVRGLEHLLQMLQSANFWVQDSIKQKDEENRQWGGRAACSRLPFNTIRRMACFFMLCQSGKWDPIKIFKSDCKATFFFLVLLTKGNDTRSLINS